MTLSAERVVELITSSMNDCKKSIKRHADQGEYDEAANAKATTLFLSNLLHTIDFIDKL